MESISGLPAHVLLVHAPVVLMPLAALAAVVLAARPGLRRRASTALAVGAGVVVGATVLAVTSGQAFDEVVGDRVDTADHESLALTTLVLVIMFLVASVLTAAADRWHGAGGPAWLDRAALGSGVVTALVAALATAWMVRTGDEGARLVWDGVLLVRLAIAG